MRRRRAVTLVELAVALALAALLVAALGSTWSSGRRGAQHAADHQGVMAAATLLQELMVWDARRSLPLDVLDDDVTAEQGSHQVVLPRSVGYDGSAETARSFSPLVYRWDLERGQLLRDGEPLPLGDLAGVEFRWSEGVPTTLTVALRGRSFAGQAPEVRFRVPAPAGTDRLRGYRFAGYHETARRAD